MSCECDSDEDVIGQLQQEAWNGSLGIFDEYGPDDFKDYNQKQIEWLQDCRYFLGEKLRHQPTEIEFIDDYQNRNLSLVFRAFYCIKNPNEIHHL